MQSRLIVSHFILSFLESSSNLSQKHGKQQSPPWRSDYWNAQDYQLHCVSSFMMLAHNEKQNSGVFQWQSEDHFVCRAVLNRGLHEKNLSKKALWVFFCDWKISFANGLIGPEPSINKSQLIPPQEIRYFTQKLKRRRGYHPHYTRCASPNDMRPAFIELEKRDSHKHKTRRRRRSGNSWEHGCVVVAWALRTIDSCEPASLPLRSSANTPPAPSPFKSTNSRAPVLFRSILASFCQ